MYLLSLTCTPPMKDARFAQVDQYLQDALPVGTTKPAQALELSRAAYTLAQEIDYPEGIARAALYRGYALYMLSEHDEALVYAKEAETRFQALEDAEGEARAWGTIAGISFSLGHYDEAMAYALRTLKRARQLNQPVSEAWCLQGMGTGYFQMGDYEAALAHFRKAEALFTPHQHIPGTDDRPRVGQARSVIGIGNVYQRTGKPDKAREKYMEARALFEKTKDNIGLARALNDLGTLAQETGQYEEALALHRESLTLRKAHGNVQSQSTSLLHIGQVYLAQGCTKDAETTLHEALILAEQTKAKLRIYQIHEALSEIYALTGDYEQALTHYKTYHAVQEQVLGDATRSKIKNIQVQFELENAEKEAEIARLRNIELKESNDRLERLLDTLHQTQGQLIHAEKMASLGQLAAGIAHEIKNPLNFINNFSSLSVELVNELMECLQDEEGTAEETQQILNDLKANQDKIHAHGLRADGIIRSMLDHSRATASNRHAADVNALLDQYLHLAYHGMRAQDASFNVTMHTDYDEAAGAVEIIPQDLGRVFLNLLNNAFYAVHKAGSTNPSVWVSSRRQGDTVEICIRDNGPGIPPEVQAKIFEPFFTTKPTGEGTGLGLWLSYDIVTKGHGGTLHAESTQGEGTTFIVLLPA